MPIIQPGVPGNQPGSVYFVKVVVYLVGQKPRLDKGPCRTELMTQSYSLTEKVHWCLIMYCVIYSLKTNNIINLCFFLKKKVRNQNFFE